MKKNHSEVNDEERSHLYAENGKNTTVMMSKVAEYADEKEAIAIEDAQIFIGYPHIIAPLMEEYGIPQDNFELYTYGDYVLFIEK